MLRRDLLKLLGITTSAAGFGLVPTLSVAGPETHPKRLGIIILEGGKGVEANLLKIFSAEQ